MFIISQLLTSNSVYIGNDLRTRLKGSIKFVSLYEEYGYHPLSSAWRDVSFVAQKSYLSYLTLQVTR